MHRCRPAQAGSGRRAGHVCPQGRGGGRHRESRPCAPPSSGRRRSGRSASRVSRGEEGAGDPGREAGLFVGEEAAILNLCRSRGRAPRFQSFPAALLPPNDEDRRGPGPTATDDGFGQRAVTSNFTGQFYSLFKRTLDCKLCEGDTCLACLTHPGASGVWNPGGTLALQSSPNESRCDRTCHLPLLHVTAGLGAPDTPHLSVAVVPSVTVVSTGG